MTTTIHHKIKIIRHVTGSNHTMLKIFIFAQLLFWLPLGPVYAACKQASPLDSDFPESLVVDSRVAVVEDENNTAIVSTWYDGATDRYRHGVLGDAIEPSILSVTDSEGCTVKVELSDEHVFEDLAPRLANLDGAPGYEVITIRSHQSYGAQIAVYQLVNNNLEVLANTPYIGTANRWLAPVGIADFNNDGDMDIAFVDRPHLAKVLRVWSFRDNELVQIAHRNGYSNHKIGEDFISGGIKTCDGTVSMITADAFWRRIMETKMLNDELVSEDIGAFTGTDSLTQATLCQ